MWPWFAVALLGAYHGLDPSMGWLFAVALGLQDRSRARVVGALGPIAIGHLLSIASVVAIIVGLSTFFAIMYVRPAGAMILILFGLFPLVWPRAHPRWVAMRVNGAELTIAFDNPVWPTLIFRFGPPSIRVLRFSYLKEAPFAGGTALCPGSRKSFLGLPKGNFFGSAHRSVPGTIVIVWVFPWCALGDRAQRSTLRDQRY
jgi:hypothetical protein